jgi:hypothetical protein
MKIRGIAPMFNPAYKRPASSITDRAKRYRAHHPDVVPNLKQCHYCGSRKNIVPDHVNGDESDNSPANLLPACKSCNTRLGKLFKRLGIGKRTAQFNAGRRSSTMAEYGAAIKVMRGEFDGDVSKAIATIRATPRSVRSAYTSKSWPVRRQIYGSSGRQARLFGDEVPF